MNPTDESLREHFRQQRERDCRQALDFHTMAARARAAARPTTTRFALPVWLATAATALVLVGAWFMVRDASGPGRGAPPDAAELLVAANAALSKLPGDAPVLSQWTSPTEFLLDAPGALMWEPVSGPK